MADYTLRFLAELTGAQPIGDLDYLVTNVDVLESATPQDVSFLANPRYLTAMRGSHAGIICIDPMTPTLPGKQYLISEQPSATFQQIAALFATVPLCHSGFEHIHPTAVIHPDSLVDPSCHVGPYVVIDQGACVGAHTRILAHAYVGAHVRIGTHCLLHAHTTIREGSILEDRVILQPGAVIGSCGFGYLTTSEGKHVKLDQMGIVHLEEDVEVGANTTIDRARFKVTRIGRGTKIDNLVQVGHNVDIGPDNLIVSQTGISGSAKTGRHVILGGQAGVVGHITLGDGVIVTARGGVSKSISERGVYAGTHVMEIGTYNRQQVHLRKITQYVKRIEELERRLAQLENPVSPCSNS